jgi:hypothetical protein
MKIAEKIGKWLKRITHRWVIVDRKELDFVIGDVKEAMNWIILYHWGEEWLECEDVVDNIGVELPNILNRLEKIAGYKRDVSHIYETPYKQKNAKTLKRRFCSC